MKPIIIIPDENQKTITMSIEEFKKTISEVWEEGYKEGQIIEKTKCGEFPWKTPTNPYHHDHVHYDIEGPSCACNIHSEAKPVDNFINKRTYDKGSSNFKTNIW